MSPMSAPAGREIDLPLCQLSQYLACNQTGRTRPYIGYQIENGAPDRIRTCDLCLRRAALYPAELRVLDAIGGNRGGRLAKPARCRQSKPHKSGPVCIDRDFCGHIAPAENRPRLAMRWSAAMGSR